MKTIVCESEKLALQFVEHFGGSIINGREYVIPPNVSYRDILRYNESIPRRIVEA